MGADKKAHTRFMREWEWEGELNNLYEKYKQYRGISLLLDCSYLRIEF